MSFRPWIVFFALFRHNLPCRRTLTHSGQTDGCADNGVCQSDGSSCQCHSDWWHGVACEVPAFACPGFSWYKDSTSTWHRSVCSSHGMCIGAGQCECHDGWSGNDCSIDIGSETDDPVHVSDKDKAWCRPGHRSRACDWNGVCAESGDACVCDYGYEGKHCQEENPCLLHDCCADNAQCIYLGDEDYECRCAPGYQGDGEKLCVPIPPGGDGGGGACCTNSTITEVQLQVRRLNATITDLTAAIMQRLDDIETTQQVQQQQLISLSFDVALLQSDLTNLGAKHNADILSVSQIHAQDVIDITAKHQTDVTNLSTRVAALEQGTGSGPGVDVLDRLTELERVTSVLALVGHLDEPSCELQVSQCNLRVWSNSTDPSHGLGNLIIGAEEEEGIGSPADRSGQHNLVLGQGNSWRGDGNLIVGRYHTVAGNASVVMGEGHAVLGGEFNHVLAGSAHIIEEDAFFSSITGGFAHEVAAASEYNVIVGGAHNSIAGADNVVVAGQSNRISEPAGRSAILGGWQNEVQGIRSSIVGGSNNLALGSLNVLVGGQGNEAGAVATQSVVLGGRDNTLTSERSVVLGTSDLTSVASEEILPTSLGLLADAGTADESVPADQHSASSTLSTGAGLSITAAVLVAAGAATATAWHRRRALTRDEASRAGMLALSSAVDADSPPSLPASSRPPSLRTGSPGRKRRRARPPRRDSADV